MEFGEITIVTTPIYTIPLLDLLVRSHLMFIVRHDCLPPPMPSVIHAPQFNDIESLENTGFPILLYYFNKVVAKEKDSISDF